MAQIGYGYGSEWQLLKMLGHHRVYFFHELKKQLGLSSDSEIHWLDYGFDNSMISGEYAIFLRRPVETEQLIIHRSDIRSTVKEGDIVQIHDLGTSYEIEVLHEETDAQKNNIIQF